MKILSLFSMLVFISLVLKAQTPYPGCPNVSAKPVDGTLSFANDTVLMRCSDNCVDLNATFLQTGSTTNYTVSSIPYAPPFSFTGGTAIFTGQDDIFSSSIPLPFSFCFFGNTYNQIVVGANGLITFNTARAGGTCCYFISNPIPRTPDATCTIAVTGNGNMYWNSINGAFHDLDPSVGGTIKYAILGTAPCRTFVLSFNDVPQFSCNNLLTTQQMVLYETTNVIEVYIKSKPSCTGWEGGRACIGIQNNNGIIGVAPPGRNTGVWTATNEAWRFTPSGPPNYTINWKNSAGTSIGNTANVNVCPSTFPAKYSVEVEYTNCNGNKIKESDTIVVINEKITGSASNDTTVCQGYPANLGVTHSGTGYTYSWTGPGVVNSSQANTQCNPTDSAWYYITVSNPSNPSCVFKDSVRVNVIKTNAGNDATTTLCNTSTPINLFPLLTGSPQTNGNWKGPNFSNFANPLNPATAASGNYYYIVQNASCPPDTAKVLVTINQQPNAGTDGLDTMCNSVMNGNLFSIISNEPSGGQWEGPGSVNASTGIVNVSSLSPGLYAYQYIVSGLAPCVNDTALANVRVKALPTAGLQSSTPVCRGNMTYLKPIFTGTPPFNLTYRDCNGQEFTSFNLLPGDSIGVTPPLPSCTYTLVSVTDGGNYSCSQNINGSQTLVALSAPVATFDSAVCNSINSAYRVYLKLSGGNPASYKINNSTSGISSSYFTSPEMNAGTNYSFTLTDKNGCTPISSVNGIKNCNCITDAGTMKPDTIKVCGSDPAIAFHNTDHKLDPNDALNFILHDAPGGSMGKVFQINNSSTSFTYNSSWGINYYQVYYISAIAGDAIGTAVDTSNPNGCMSVANGLPVIFYPLPQASANIDSIQVCKGNSCGLVANLSTGLFPFTLNYLDELGNAQTSAPFTSAGNVHVLNPSQIGNNNYTVTEVIDAAGCRSPLSIPLSVAVVDKPDTTGLSISCNSSNTMYTVQFNVFNGDAPSYSVNGSQLSGNSYTSAPISSGQAYNFVLSDKNNCQPLVISGTHTCPCISNAGTMSIGPAQNPLEFCITQKAQASHQGNEVLDGNDVLSFILCTDPNNPISSLVQINDSALFGFVPGMTVNTVYYICPIAGDNDGLGLVNLSALCKNTSAGTPLRFIALPTVSISGTTHICEGTSATISIQTNGNGNVSFDLIGSDGSKQSLSGNGSFTATISPNVSSGIVTYTIDTIGGNKIYDSTSPQSCYGSWTSAPVLIYVHPKPTASISGNYTLCLGQSIPIDIVLTGDSVLNAPFSSSSYAGSVQGRSGTYKPVLTPSTTGVHTYTLTSVTDNTPAQCVGTVSGSAQITVRALPTASMSIIDPQVCRGESSGPQFVIAGQPNLSIFYRDQAGNTFSQTGLAPGTYSYPFVPAISTTFFLDSILDGTLSDATNKACKTTYLNQSAFVDVRPLPIGVLSGDTGICRGESTTIRFDLSQSAPDAAPFSLVYQSTPSMGGSAVADSLSGLPLNSSIIVQPNDSTMYELLRLYDRFGCRSINFSGRAQVDVYPIPLPVMAASDTASCMPLLTQLINLTDPSFTGTYTWDFGDGTSYTGSGQSQPIAHTYAQPGSYSVRLTVKSAQGCVKDSLIYNFLTAHPYPVAQFSYSPTVPNILEPELRFSNLSTLNYSNQWTFSTGLGEISGTSSLAQPSFRFPDEDSGSYSVKLRVESAFGCADSTKQQIFINGITESFIPSAFSPNGDGINEVFRPIHVGERALQYEFSVFNRWGERIFYTTNPKEGWDGTYQGELAKPDTYVFSVVVRSKYNAEKKVYRGAVNLLR